MSLSLTLRGQAPSWVRGFSRSYSTSGGVILPSINVPSAEQNDQIAQHYQRIKLREYNVNYVKVGHGPNAVFCFPGVLGAMRTHLTQLIKNFEKHRDTYTFYAWDQPGYGLSRPPERVFTDESVQEDADMCLEMLKTFGHDKYSIMGWSGGGLSALLFAAQYPELCKKLMVWGAFSYVDKSDAEQFQWFHNVENWTGKMQEVLVEEYGREFFVKGWQTWMEIFSRIYTHRAGEFCDKQLHKIQCPTFIVHGAKDRIVPVKHGYHLHKHIKNSKLLVMPEGKHNPQIRYHEEFFAAVHEFLSSDP